MPARVTAECGAVARALFCLRMMEPTPWSSTVSDSKSFVLSSSDELLDRKQRGDVVMYLRGLDTRAMVRQ